MITEEEVIKIQTALRNNIELTKCCNDLVDGWKEVDTESNKLFAHRSRVNFS